MAITKTIIDQNGHIKCPKWPQTYRPVPMIPHLWFPQEAWSSLLQHFSLLHWFNPFHSLQTKCRTANSIKSVTPDSRIISHARGGDRISHVPGGSSLPLFPLQLRTQTQKWQKKTNRNEKRQVFCYIGGISAIHDNIARWAEMLPV